MIGKTLAGEEDERLDQLESLGGVRVGDSITVAYSNGQVRRYHVKGIFQTDSFNADSAVYVTRTRARLRHRPGGPGEPDPDPDPD